MFVGFIYVSGWFRVLLGFCIRLFGFLGGLCGFYGVFVGSL